MAIFRLRCEPGMPLRKGNADFHPDCPVNLEGAERCSGARQAAGELGVSCHFWRNASVDCHNCQPCRRVKFDVTPADKPRITVAKTWERCPVARRTADFSWLQRSLLRASPVVPSPRLSTGEQRAYVLHINVGSKINSSLFTITGEDSWHGNSYSRPTLAYSA